MIPLWLLYSLGASLSYGVCTMFDKYIPGRINITVTSYFMINSFFAVFGAVLAAMIWPIEDLPTSMILFCMAVGYFAAFNFYCYFQAAVSLEAPVISGFWQMGRVLTILIGFFVFDERITWLQGAGVVIVLFASLLLATEYKLSRLLPQNRHHIATGVYWMLAASILIGINNGFEKFLLLDISAPTVFFYGSFGYTLLGMTGLLVPKFLKDLKHDAKKISPKMYAIIFIRKLFGSGGVFFVMYAMSVGPLSLVSASRATQSLIVFLYVLILPKFGFDFIKEDHAETYKKLPALILIIFGVFLAAEVL